MPRTPLLLIIILALGLAAPASPGADFFTLRTGNMRLVYYSPTHSYIVPHLARSFENSLAFHRKLFHFEPSQDVLIFLQDYDDYGYAGATSIPRNYMILGISPYEYTYETSPTNERFNWVTSHELTHIVATDKAAPSDRFFRSILFGKVVPVAEEPVSILYSYLTTPRKYSPRWYHEGIAVFMETWMAGGIGRAINGYDEMVFRTMVREGSYFYDFVGLESEGTTVDFQIGANSYLYGTRFVTYLGREFSPARVIEWFDRSDTSNAYFASAFAKVFGRDIDDVWSEWIAFEHRWQEANLDSINQYPRTQMRPIVPEALGAVSRAHFDGKTRNLYLGVNFPGETAHIISLNIDNGSIRKITDIPTPSLYNVTATAFDDSSGTLYYTTKNSKGWRDLVALDVRTGQNRILLANARIGDLTMNKADKSLWGIQHHDGISRLVRVPYPYQGYQEIVPFKYGIDLYDPDFSPDGETLVASMTEISGRHSLIAIPLNELLSADMKHEVLYEFENTAPLNFVYSPDGKYLFGSTFYTGVSNIVRYDIASKTMEWLTNVETGLFRPVPVSADSVLAFRYTAKGFLPVMIANTTRDDVHAISYLGQSVVDLHPEVKEWKLPPPTSRVINLDSLTVATGEYNGLESIQLGSIYPVAQGYKNTVAWGARANLFDPLLMHSLEMTASYSPNQGLTRDERFHTSVRYRYWQWSLKAGYNSADFYDLFGPTKRSRKGYAFTLGYSDGILDDRPVTLDYSLSASAYWGLERLPYSQNIAVTYDRFFVLSGSLDYQRRLRSLGAVDYEKGVQMSVGNYTYVVRSVWFPQFYATADVGFALPWNHSSLWIRTGGGYSPKDEDEPFSNFYFGGFGNNYVDFREVSRYRDFDSFPGTKLNAIGGTTFAKAMAEWTLPPLRFRRFGVAALYCNWTRLSLFGGSIAANVHNPALFRVVSNVGAQVDFKLVVFSNLSATLSAGYALAFEKGRLPTKEFMMSIKIL